MPLPVAAVAGISAAASLLGQGIGGLFSSRSRKRAERRRRQAMDEAVTMYGRRLGEDPTQRAGAQQTLEYIRERIKENAARRRGQGVVNGGTNAAEAAGAEADANMVARTAGNIVAANDQRTTQLEDRITQVKNGYAQAQAAADEESAAEQAQAAAKAVGAIGNAAVTLADGGGTKDAKKTEAPKTSTPNVRGSMWDEAPGDYEAWRKKNRYTV